MKYEAVIFDLFGTLVNVFSRQEYEKAVEEMASILGAPHDEFTRLWLDTAKRRVNGFFQTLEENIEYICRGLKVNIADTQLQLAKQVRFNFVAHSLKPREDALEVLERLKSKGYKTGLISNCSTETPVIWPDTLFAPLFDVAVFSSSVGLQKPDPRIYQLAIERLRVKPENCLYIGDGDDQELSGASQIGMYPVLICDPDKSVDAYYFDREEWGGPKISSLREILTLLE